MRTALLRFAAAFVAASTFVAGPAMAQDSGEGGWIVTLGAGAQVVPRYPGADDVVIAPLPNFGLRREGQPMPFEAPDDGFGFGVLGRDSAFNFGPAIRVVGKRDEDDVGRRVGDVGFTFEVGGFAQVWLGDNVRLRGELRQGLGGHDGLVGDIAADFVIRDADTYIFSIGPRARWADGTYHDAYYGVTPAVSALTALPAYNPGSGFHAVGARAGYTQRLGRTWGFFGYAGYDRLVGDAGRSPIVRTLGSRDQFSGGLGLFVEFRVGR